MKHLMCLAATCCLLIISCNKVEEPFTKVVAHRGYWKTEGSAQNSLTALKLAGDIKVYGCELDVNMTSDEVLVVNHDFNIGQYEICDNPYDSIKNTVLKNGETLPTLDQYLEAAVAYPKLKLVFELKSHGDSLYEAKAIPASIEALKKYGLVERTEFISFSLTACQEYARLLPDNMVEYLSGSKTPAELKEMGINGLDYHYTVFDKHPEWIKEAHDLGMICNAWTVDKEEDITRMLTMGVDFITTNQPVLTDSLRRAFPIEGQRQQ